MATIYIRSLYKSVCIYTKHFEEAFFKARMLCSKPLPSYKLYDLVSRASVYLIGQDDFIQVRIYHGHRQPPNLSQTLLPVVTWETVLQDVDIQRHLKWLAFRKNKSKKFNW